MDLDQVEALAAVKRADLAGGAGEEAGVALEVGAGAAAWLGLRGAVEADLSGPDRELGVVVEADAVDPVATLGEGACLALDARVDLKVRVVDHADPQAVAAGGGRGAVRALAALQSSRPQPLSR